ncbi:MAG: HAMP domain-containing sensor histidine kinase [Myxococcales bacterium]
MPREERPRRRRLLLHIYGVGIVTMIAVAGTLIVMHVPRDRVPRYVVATTKFAIQVAGQHLADGSVAEYLAQLRRETDLQVSLYDRNGALLGSNVTPPLPAPTADDQKRALTHPELRGDNVVVALHQGGAIIGYGVGRHTRPGPRNDPRWDVLIALAWIGLAALVLSRTLGGPLDRIATAARAFGRGDLSVRTGVNRGDEIGDVARAFDDMSASIVRLMEGQRELLAGVSHELRTPLARIRVALDLAAEGDAETARTSLVDVRQDLEELEGLISNIFSAARLEMAVAARGPVEMPLAFSHLDVVSLVNKAVERLRVQFRDRPFLIDVSAPALTACIDGDSVLIRRALENVVENAHKYSPAGSEVNIRLEVKDGTIIIAVTDRGIGIAPSDLPRVFAPFFRTDRSRTRSTGGIGLGLALAKRVAESHGGAISIESAVDRGTRVTFTFPAVVAASQRPIAATASLEQAS